MMPDPYPSTPGSLQPHWNTLLTELAPYLDAQASKISLTADAVGEEIVSSFRGEVARRANRYRGGPVPVVPLRSVLARSWEAWIGYREVWALLRAPNSFAFSSADITVFLTVANSGVFQQVLRAEWIGVEEEADGWSFRPSDAGHPHWQIDVTEAVRADAELEAARQLLLEATPREFGSVEPSRAYPAWYEIGRMHLASAMRPWVDADIAHGPTSLLAIRAWVIRTIEILSIELARL
jgi:hypothetical protein